MALMSARGTAAVPRGAERSGGLRLRGPLGPRLLLRTKTGGMRTRRELYTDSCGRGTASQSAREEIGHSWFSQNL
eukprot:4494728-Prymnesium_polylepis.1